MLGSRKCHLQWSKEAIRSLKPVFKSLEKGDNGFGATMGIQWIMENQCDDDLVN